MRLKKLCFAVLPLVMLLSKHAQLITTQEYENIGAFDHATFVSFLPLNRHDDATIGFIAIDVRN